MVYFIGNIEQDIVKIGYASNVKRRFEQLKTSCPYELTLFKTIEGEIFHEKQLHEYYKEFKLNKEWFKLSKLNLNDVDNFVFKEKTTFTIEPKEEDNLINVGMLFSLNLSYSDITRILKLIAVLNENNIIDLTFEEISKYLNFDKDSFTKFLKRIPTILVKYQKCYLMNPSLARKRKTLNRELLEIFDDLTIKNK